MAENCFYDPTREEMAVADCVVAVSVDWDGHIIGCRTLESGTVGEGGIRRAVLKRIIRGVGAVGKEVFGALEAIVNMG